MKDIWKVKGTPAQFYIQLNQFEKNCGPLGVSPHMIFEITEAFLGTGKHDSTMFPDFKVKRISKDALEIYDSRFDYYIIITTLPNYKWLWFPITAEDREKMGEPQFQKFVEWFVNISR